MPARLIDTAPPRASKLPAAPSAAPARPASEDAGQCSRAIIPGDDPGDQQPPKSTPVPVTHVDIDRSKANELGISMRSIGDTPALLVGEHYVNRFNRVGCSCEVIQQVPLTPETLTRYYVNSAAGQPVAAVQPRHAQESNRAECGLKIFGIAVGLLIPMATVALLSMQMTRTVDGQLAIMPSRLT